MSMIKTFNKLHKRLGMTDETLGEYLGVERTTIWRWKTGQTRIPLMAIRAMEAAKPVVKWGSAPPDID